MNALLLASAILFSSPADCYPAAEIVFQSKQMKDAGADMVTAYKAAVAAHPSAPDYLVQHQVVMAYGQGWDSLTPDQMYQMTMQTCMSRFSSKKQG